MSISSVSSSTSSSNSSTGITSGSSRGSSTVFSSTVSLEARDLDFNFFTAFSIVGVFGLPLFLLRERGSSSESGSSSPSFFLMNSLRVSIEILSSFFKVAAFSNSLVASLGSKDETIVLSNSFVSSFFVIPPSSSFLSLFFSSFISSSSRSKETGLGSLSASTATSSLSEVLDTLLPLVAFESSDDSDSERIRLLAFVTLVPF